MGRPRAKYFAAQIHWAMYSSRAASESPPRASPRRVSKYRARVWYSAPGTSTRWSHSTSLLSIPNSAHSREVTAICRASASE
ncbi:Uncharacterised protein [Mycobacteroides abscessus subsp. abscessus]|nr:Uncharacterised protein [Mycobacteroides abscessus subsp. abscessus]